MAKIIIISQLVMAKSISENQCGGESVNGISKMKSVKM